MAAKRNVMPWTERVPRSFEGFQREMEGLMERFFGNEPGWLGSAAYAPLSNVAESETEYEITFDLPGLKPEDVKVELHEGQLVVSGERSAQKEEEGKTFHRIERSYGQFRRSIPIPGAVDVEKIDATYRDGVLTVKLPKSEKEKPKRIDIKS